tara:strand:- start:1665 stop:1904 length:240 start_codon:yes stop_codon:yes gene_type:complete
LSQTLESPNDWVTMGVIHAFKVMKAIQTEADVDHRDVILRFDQIDFDYLIDIQRRNLENPSLFEHYDEIFIKLKEDYLK